MNKAPQAKRTHNQYATKHELNMVNVIVSSDPEYRVNRMDIQATVTEVLKRFNVTDKVEIGVTIVGDRKMHEINQKYRGLDQTTNVLSFALDDPTSLNLKHIPSLGFISSPDNVLRLGDILISYPQAVEEAKNDNVTVDEAVRYLVEHGMNHLLGDHIHD